MADVIMELISRAVPMFAAMIYLNVMARRISTDCMRLQEHVHAEMRRLARDKEETPATPPPEPDAEPAQPLPVARVVQR